MNEKQIHQMRRFKQELSKKEIEEILIKNTNGILALNDSDGYPYGIPISYVYDNNTIYMHSATAGHKIDLIKENPNACFTVVDQDKVVPEKYTTFFKSVMVFGKVEILSEKSDVYPLMEMLGKKYAPYESDDSLHKEIDSSLGRFVVLKLNIEQTSGKQAIELVPTSN